MIDAPPPPRAPTKRPAKNSIFLIALIIAAAIVIALQYTPYAMFSRETTSTLWGMLTGLILGGVLFGWLRFRRGESGSWFE
jgi:archaellum biogenesis protein FlaJ (TadC family)